MKLKVIVLAACILQVQSFAGNCSTFYQQAEADSIPVGFAYQSNEQQEKTVRPRAAKWTRKTRYALPALFVGYGFTSLNKGIVRETDLHIRHELSEEYPGFSTHLDNQLQYAPIATVYALNMLGVKSKNNFLDRTAMMLISNAIVGVSVDFLKVKTHKLRPSGSDTRSFPSGHTSTAFAGAEFMRQELGETSKWYGYVGYSMATATGALRMMNNQHWLSDVIAGAGVGILSTKLTYLVYPWIKKKIIKDEQLKFIAVPMVRDRIVGLSLMAPL